MPIYSHAPPEVLELIKKLILSDAFPHLREMYEAPGPDNPGITFDLLLAYAPENKRGEKVGTALKLRGLSVAAIIRQTSLKERNAGRADIEITIDGDVWPNYEEQRQEALIHHELSHLEPRRDKHQALKKDDIGRPLFRMKPHDWEIWGFHETAKIYGYFANEVSAAHDMHRAFGQTVFQFMEAEPTLPMNARRAA